ncbi:MAG: hypothetical protein WBA41_25650 [Rivularia sp. (in: cyanobacteria)]
MICENLFCHAIAINNNLISNCPAIGVKNYSIQNKEKADIFDKSNLLAQAQFQIDIGELGYDFNPITQAEITTDSQDEFNQNNPLDAIQFIAEAKQFILPLGYTAHFYDRNGVEIGFVPVDIHPAASIEQRQTVYVTIPLILLNTNAQIFRMVIQRL